MTTPPPITDLGPLKIDPMASQRVLEAIKSTQTMAMQTQYLGELVTIETVVGTMMGDPLEVLILLLFLPFLYDHLSISFSVYFIASVFRDIVVSSLIHRR